jgi:hypothetical protein
VKLVAAAAVALALAGCGGQPASPCSKNAPAYHRDNGPLRFTCTGP